ncbi:retention module-containing protein [Neptuniibacter sp. QD37_6]|uniref:retention module-containing protein n=1 Tax=Neptuniibacter sp. QD37_6 TaxID=3398210 RepID=UPI0039F46B0A
MSVVIGSVSQISGKVVAISPDGSERTLALGDPVYEDDLIKVSQDGSVEIDVNNAELVALESGQVWLVSSETFSVIDNIDPSEYAVSPEFLDAALAAEVAENAEDAVELAREEAAAAEEAGETFFDQANADAEAEAEAIQAAILAGVDPTEVGEATAAGGEPAAGDGGNEGSSTVNITRTAEEVDPTAGYDTIGFEDTFEEPEEELLPGPDPEEPPVVSVSVEVEVVVETPSDPEDPENPELPNETTPVVLSPEGVLVLEGTESGDGTETRDVTFNLVLDKVFDQDVVVTYQFNILSDNSAADYGSEEDPQDWTNGGLVVTETIPAGTTVIPVTITITQDHLAEGDGVFEIVLIDAVNATINPDASSETVTIIDDDTTPTAFDDQNAVTEDDAEEGFPETTGNVIGGAGVSAGDVADIDEDGDIPSVISFSFEGAEAAPGETLEGMYGELTLNSDGSYTYTLTDNDSAEIQSLTADGEPLVETFTYVINDGYNLDPEDESEATLTITINGADDSAEVTVSAEGPDSTVYEAGLAAGSDELADSVPDNDDSEQDTGTFGVSATDGIESITVNGVTFTVEELLATNDTAVNVGSTGIGTLTITGFSWDADQEDYSGQVSYIYELDEAQTHGEPGSETDGIVTDSVAVSVLGIGGSNDSDNLSINIHDDAPEAIDDFDGVTEDGAAATGNVIAGNDDTPDTQDAEEDVQGADRDGGYAKVVGVALGSTEEDLSGDVGNMLYGTYGTLTLGEGGGYTYTQYTYDMVVAAESAAEDYDGGDADEQARLDALAEQLADGYAAIQALNGSQEADEQNPEGIPADTVDDVFSYTLEDADGDKDTAQLTITVTGEDDTTDISFAGDEQVDEAGLPFGSAEYSDGDETNDSDTSERVNGTISVSASDGIDDVVIGGITLTLADLQALDGTTEIDTGEGTLTLNSYTPTDGDAAELGGSIAYTYTLDATIDNDSIIPSGDDTVDDDAFNDSIAVTVNGIGGSLAEDDLVIEVLDDVPDAIADVDAIDEDAAPISGNVITGATADPNDTDGTGADTEGADRYATVYGVAVGSVASNVVIDDGVGATLYGSYGTLTMGSTGGYTYTQYTYDMAVALRTAADTAQDNLDAYGPDDGEPEYDDLVAARDEADALADQVEAGFAAIQALNGEQPAQEKTQLFQLIHWMMSSAIPWRMQMLSLQMIWNRMRTKIQQR